MKEKIDFVLLWVDGNDKKWQDEKAKYSKNSGDKNKIRFRDWEILQYWFRGVEKYAPWVNNIFFITWGHIPKWLNTNNPKIKIVKHEDFISQKYLPTFNSNVIELNLFRIKELSEHFVLFNDDVFLINYTKPTDFFKNGLPCDSYFEVNFDSSSLNKIFASTVTNNYSIINKYFNKKEVYLKHPFKYFNFKYGFKNNLRTLNMLKKSDFRGIYNFHLCQSFLKSDFKKVYDLEKEKFEIVYNNRFRNETDISQYLIRYFNLLNGNFIPRKSIGKAFGTDSFEFVPYLTSQKGKVICLNDSDPNIDFEKTKEIIIQSFEKILSEKSSFEK